LRADGDLPIHGLVEIESQSLPRGSTVVIITPSVKEEVAFTADLLVRRGMRVVVVLLDAVSFGGSAGTEQVESMLRFMKTPVRMVRRGDDLTVALSVS
jgi:hypothetical protein